MRAAAGLGLAAPQVGVQKRLFVYQMGEDEGPKVIVNPVITESRGEWEFEEGCLSIPGLYFPIVRPKEVHLTGYDLDGNEVSIEADELMARVFQHELDHLDGTLLLEYLDKDQRKAALRELRRRAGGRHAARQWSGPATGAQRGRCRRCRALALVYLGTPDAAVAPLRALVERAMTSARRHPGGQAAGPGAA